MVLGWGFPTVNGSIPSNCRTWHCAHSHMAWIVRIQAGQEIWGFPPLHSPTYLSCMPSQSHIIFRLECQIVQVSRRRMTLCNGDDCLMLWPLWAATSSPVHATVSLNCINHILVASQVKSSQAKRINMSEERQVAVKGWESVDWTGAPAPYQTKLFTTQRKCKPPSPSLKLPLHPHPPLKLPLAVHIICIWIQHPTYFPIFLLSSVRVHSLFRNLLRVSP